MLESKMMKVETSITVRIYETLEVPKVADEHKERLFSRHRRLASHVNSQQSAQEHITCVSSSKKIFIMDGAGGMHGLLFLLRTY